MHCDGCSCASDIGASLDAQLADATPSALRDGRDLLIRDGALVVRRYGRPVGAVMICDCCGHEFFGTPNGVRLCNRNDCVAAFVKMHVGHTVRALGCAPQPAGASRRAVCSSIWVTRTLRQKIIEATQLSCTLTWATMS